MVFPLEVRLPRHDIIQQHMDHEYSIRAAQAWRGHHPITSVALLSLLDRAAVGQPDFSRVERQLWVVCEFWAAVNACELDAHLDSGTEDPLHDAHCAFRAIGADHVADTLDRAAVETAGDSQPVASLRYRSAELEHQLLRVPDAVDDLIARFAGQYLCTLQRPAAAARRALGPERGQRRLLA